MVHLYLKLPFKFILALSWLECQVLYWSDYFAITLMGVALTRGDPLTAIVALQVSNNCKTPHRMRGFGLAVSRISA